MATGVIRRVDGGSSGEICPVKAGYRYNRDYFSFQIISYLKYDDAWQFGNGGYDFTSNINPLTFVELDLATDPTGNTLLHDNEKGNKFRWTDDSGVKATSSTPYTIDHFTGLAYVRPTTTRSSYNNVFDVGGVLETLNVAGYLGFNDYFVPNGKMILSMSTFAFKDGDRAIMLPLMAFSIYEILSSSTYRIGATSVYDSNHAAIISTVAKTSNSVFQNIYCRIHYKS